MTISCAFSRLHQVCSAKRWEQGCLSHLMESLLCSQCLETGVAAGPLSPHIPKGGRWARSDVLGNIFLLFASLWQTAYPCMVEMILGLLCSSKAVLSIHSRLLLLVTAMAENLHVPLDSQCLGCTDPAEKIRQGSYSLLSWRACSALAVAWQFPTSTTTLWIASVVLRPGFVNKS